jgi:hypothetical protein
MMEVTHSGEISLESSSICVIPLGMICLTRHLTNIMEGGAVDRTCMSRTKPIATSTMAFDGILHQYLCLGPEFSRRWCSSIIFQMRPLDLRAYFRSRISPYFANT